MVYSCSCYTRSSSEILYGKIDELSFLDGSLSFDLLNLSWEFSLSMCIFCDTLIFWNRSQVSLKPIVCHVVPPLYFKIYMNSN